MATAKTWLWIILGFLGICVLGLAVVAGAGVYFVSKHIQVKPTTGASALQTFDAARAQFKSQPPLLELDEFEHARSTRKLSEMPTSAVKPANLHLLVWDVDENHLVNISIPFWVLRFGRQRMRFSNSGFDVERLNLDVPELERIGPALVLDYRAPAGDRVLIWTQ
jgi:hypothetical protein